jgi:hypothetical protein
MRRVGKRPKLFVFGVVAATALSFYAAFMPVSAAISKISGEIWLIARGIFLKASVPALLVGLAFVCLAILLAERQRVLAIILLIASPVAALALGFQLFS